MINSSAKDINNIFKSYKRWFLLPLKTYTLLLALNEKTSCVASSPNKIFICYEYSKPISKTHIAHIG